MNSITNVTLKMLLLVLFSLAIAHFTADIQAQDRSPGPEPVTRDTDFESRSNTLRNMTATKPAPEAKPIPRPDPEQVLREAREDYMFLQVDNKALKQALAATTPLEPKIVFDSVTDIRKRAERLNTNLALPEADKKAEHAKITSATNPEELRASVANLSTLIRSFVGNPCFREPALLVNEQTMKARVDLEDILALSKQLLKDSEKFAPASAKP